MTILSAPQLQNDCLCGPVAWHASALHFRCPYACPKLPASECILKGEETALLTLGSARCFAQVGTEQLVFEWRVMQNSQFGWRKQELVILVKKHLDWVWVSQDWVNPHKAQVSRKNIRVCGQFDKTKCLKGGLAGCTVRKDKCKSTSFWLRNYTFMKKEKEKLNL